MLLNKAYRDKNGAPAGVKKNKKKNFMLLGPQRRVKGPGDGWDVVTQGNCARARDIFLLVKDQLIAVCHCDTRNTSKDKGNIK